MTLITTISHACELIGVFLLSVEAIKISNFRRLNDRVLRPVAAVLNPQVRIVDANEIPEAASGANLFFAFLLIMMAIGLIAAVAISTHWPVSATVLRPWRWDGIFWLWRVLLLVPFAFGCLLAGGLVHTAAVASCNAVISLLEHLEQTTERGIIGLLGFAFFLVYWLTKVFAE